MYAIAASKRRGETHKCSRDNGHLDSATKLSCSHGDVWQHPHPGNAVPIRPRQHFGGNRLRVRVSFIFIMHTCNMQRQGVGNKWKVLSKVIMLCCCFCKLFCGFFYEKRCNMPDKWIRFFAYVCLWLCNLECLNYS